MARRVPHVLPARWCRPMAALALLGLWLSFGPGVTAAEGSPAAAHAHAATATASAPKAERAGHHCRCGMDCVGKCCCAPREPSEPAPGPAPKPTSGEPGAGRASAPCWASSPCGDGGALPPVARAAVGIGDPVGGAGAPRIEAAPGGDRLAPPSSDRAGGSSPARVDEPPERSDDA